MSLAKLDLIGQLPPLYIKGALNHKSTIGGIFTIATFFFSILCFVGFGLDLFERKKAEILNSKEYVKDNRIERDQLHFFVLP